MARTSTGCPITAAAAPFDPRKRLGDDACPFTAGYWVWVHRHHDLLAANHRTARAVASLNRLADRDAVVELEAARERF